MGKSYFYEMTSVRITNSYQCLAEIVVMTCLGVAPSEGL